MSDFEYTTQQRLLARARKGPAVIDEDRVGLNHRIAAWLTARVGSMWVVYFTVSFVLFWMLLGTYGPLHRLDPYPFPFLLFVGNVIQLLLVFVILVGQQVLGRAADNRSLQTYEDAEAIFEEVSHLHDHLEEQDKILNRGIRLVERRPHPYIDQHKVVKPAAVEDELIGRNGQIAAWITKRVGSMWAFYAAAVLQFGWIALALLGIIRFDPYPFAFLLFLSSLAQLVFMFVIMVGQDVLGKAGDKRAQQTFIDAEVILHECLQLQRHLAAQDRLIVKVCDYIHVNAPRDHPIHTEMGKRAQG
jgi:uncharacterized membrane protein